MTFECTFTAAEQQIYGVRSPQLQDEHSRLVSAFQYLTKCELWPPFILPLLTY